MPPNSKIIPFLFLPYALLALNCGSNSNEGRDVAFDEQETYVQEPFEASFVASRLQLGTVDEGINLDGMNTWCTDGTCIPDGLDGVDNQLILLLEALENAANMRSDVNGDLMHEVESGNRLMVFRLTGINIDPMGEIASFDPDVQLKIYYGIDKDDPADPDDNFSGSEPLDVDAASLWDDSNVEDAIIDFPNCTIANSILRCGPSTLFFDFPFLGTVVSLMVIEAHLEAVIEHSPARDDEGHYANGRITNGVLGGYCRIIDHPVEIMKLSLAADVGSNIIEWIMEQKADIDAIPEGETEFSCSDEDNCMTWQDCRAGSCYEPANKFDSFSVGLVFELTSIRFTGNIIEPANP